MANPTIFQTNARLSQIAMAVRAEGVIADQVCPRISVPSDKFIFSKANEDDVFTIPDTAIGRKSEANEVEFGAVDVTDSVNDYALDDFVPQRDIQQAADAGANYDPLAAATEGVSMLIDLSREKRVADLYQTLGNFDANLRTTLSGTDQWDNLDTNGNPTSTPAAQILDAFQTLLMPPNIAVMGNVAWRHLRTHPEMVAMALNRGGTLAGGTAAKGILSKQQVAELLELDDIFVGLAFFNAAKKGQAVDYQRLWGKHATFLRIDKNIRTVRGFAMPTFAFTAQWGNRFSGTIPEAKRGIDGGQTVRVGERVKELISYSKCAYHFHNVVS